MEYGVEVAYLRRRLGFVRLAMQLGVPIVPVFGAGQSKLYSYWRPFYDSPKGWISRKRWSAIARKIGFVPMVIWGWKGTPIPRQKKMTIVVGRPIQVPHHPSIEEIDDEIVEEWLDVYIKDLQSLYHDFLNGSLTNTVPAEEHPPLIIY